MAGLAGQLAQLTDGEPVNGHGGPLALCWGLVAAWRAGWWERLAMAARASLRR